MLEIILYEKLTELKLHPTAFCKQGETGTGDSMEKDRLLFAEDRQHNLACTCILGLIAVSCGTAFGCISGFCFGLQL